MKRITTLSHALQAQPETATALIDAFVAEHTFPLHDGDTAIFFYSSSEPIDAIYLVHWVFGLESRQAYLPLGHGAWYLPLGLPHSARVEYKLEVHRGGERSWIRDPVNPLQAFDPFGSNSVATMPGYTVPSWVSPEVGCRPGQLTRFEMPSAVYGDVRTIEVYLPTEYKAQKKYPLVICHDGPDYLRFADIRTVLDNLIHRHEVHPLVVAFIRGHARNDEYAANPLQPAFLADEVLPAMRERFGISDDPDAVGLMGASFGAVSSLHTGWTRPGVFGKLLLQSGSFVFTDVGHHGRSPLWDPIVAFVNAFREDPARLQSRLFMSCGTFESLITFNRSLVPLLRDEGIQVRFVEAQDGHNWIAWRDRLREGLTWLYPGHLWMVYE